MNSVYFFEIDEKTEYDRNDLPENIRDHCKKPESIASALALIQMGALNLRYEENGKPVTSNCFVSISHSKNMVAVCTSDKPVGIDIEYIDHDRNYDKIAKRFYRGKELEYVKDSLSHKFYEIWTRKEAYVKLLGTGVSEVVKGFDVLSLDGYSFETEIIGEYVISTCEKR